jgi:predicted DNA-binding transcriptional regulator YafY
MSEQKRIKRLFGIYNRLKRGAMTIETLHKWCKSQDIHVSARTIYRDIEDISHYFHHKEEELLEWQGEFNKTYWRIVKRDDAPGESNYTLNDQMTEALLATGAVTPLPVKDIFGEGYYKAVDFLLEKQNSKSFPMQTLQQHIISTHWGESRYTPKHKKFIHDVIWSIENQRHIEIETHQKSKSKNHTSDFGLYLPRKIVLHKGGLYFMVQKQDHIQFIDIEAICKLNISHRHQEKLNSDHDIYSILNQRFGISGNNLPTVKLRIQFDATESIPASILVHTKNWHPSQKLKKGKSGSAILEMQCEISDELVSWILSWMDYAEVISPPELKAYVLEKAHAITQRYQPLKATRSTQNSN